MKKFIKRLESSYCYNFIGILAWLELITILISYINIRDEIAVFVFIYGCIAFVDLVLYLIVRTLMFIEFKKSISIKNQKYLNNKYIMGLIHTGCIMFLLTVLYIFVVIICIIITERVDNFI